MSDMDSYHYFNFQQYGYLSYAVLTKMHEDTMHLYVLDPTRGSKEYELEKSADAVSNPALAIKMVEQFVGGTHIQDESQLSDLRKSFYAGQLSDGRTALIHQVYYPDEFMEDNGGIEPLGTYLIQLLDARSYTSFELAKDYKNNLFLPIEDDLIIDSLILDELGQYIETHLAGVEGKFGNI